MEGLFSRIVTHYLVTGLIEVEFVRTFLELIFKNRLITISVYMLFVFRSTYSVVYFVHSKCILKPITMYLCKCEAEVKFGTHYCD
jgi:hypothetical protein